MSDGYRHFCTAYRQSFPESTTSSPELHLCAQVHLLPVLAAVQHPCTALAPL